jgi:hypothetical protein
MLINWVFGRGQMPCRRQDLFLKFHQRFGNQQGFFWSGRTTAGVISFTFKTDNVFSNRDILHMVTVGRPIFGDDRRSSFAARKSDPFIFPVSPMRG